jgi:PAS domain S-box-containing protein
MPSEHPAESIEFLKTILSSSPELIGVITKDGVFRYVNKVVEGLTIEKVIGTSMYDYASKDDIEAMKGYVATALAENRPVRYETRAMGPNGSESVYACIITPFTYNGEQLIVSIGSDVTEQKKAEEELQAKLKQLEMLNESMVNREIKMIELKKKLEALGHQV